MKRSWLDLVGLMEEYFDLSGQTYPFTRDPDLDRRPGESLAHYRRRTALIGSIKQRMHDHSRRFEQYCKLQPEVTRLQRAHPDWSKNYVATLVGRKFGISPRTVKRNTHFWTRPK